MPARRRRGILHVFQTEGALSCHLALQKCHPPLVLEIYGRFDPACILIVPRVLVLRTKGADRRFLRRYGGTIAPR